MAARRFLTVICYDVDTDKRRRKLAAKLEQVAVRVQWSVFEGWFTTAEVDRLFTRLRDHVGPDDSLRAYVIAPDGLHRCRTLGPTPAPSGASYHLL